MVIGISGRLGSGKDTVGKIIQYLTAEDVGADCLKRIRAGLSIDGHHNSSFENKKFAGKLKLIGSILSGVPVENFEDQDFKKLPMSLDWEMTYREFLQKLGTEAMRDGLHKNVWVNALFADYRTNFEAKNAEEWGKNLENNWIITDMRFPNELDAVELREGITIRVNRDNGTREIDTNPHPSETALDDAKFHYIIDNDGSFEDLMKKVEEILKIEKIPLKRWSI